MSAVVRRVTLALTACLLLAPAVAHASWQAVIIDCRDGKMDSHHSLKDYTEAYSKLSSDAIEYTDCQGVIRRAQLAAAAAGGKRHNGGGGSGGSTAGANSGSSGTADPNAASPPATPTPTPGADPLAAATPVQRAAVTNASQAGQDPVRVGKLVVTPASLGDGSETALPTALVVLLLALVVGGLGVGVASVAPHVRARRAR